MGGRLIDYIAQGDAADIPLAADMPARIAVGAASIYYEQDTGNFRFFNASTVAWDTWTTQTTEAIQDMLSTFLVNGTGITLTYDDALNTLTIACTVAAYTDENAMDAIAAAFAAGVHTGITVTYDDAGNAISLACTVTQYTDEMAADAIAALIAAGVDSGLSITYDDAGNAISFAVNVAADTDIWGGTSDTKFITPKRLKDWRTPVALVDGATITLDGTTGVNFYVTLGGNRILANPTNFNPGQFGVIHVTQDGTGTRTLTFGTNWKFGSTSIAGNVLSVAAGATDAIHYYVRADGTITCFVVQSLTSTPARLKLDDLSNVNMTTPPTNGQVLTYDTATSKWKPATAAGGSSTPWYWSPPLASAFTLSNGGGAGNMVLTDDADVGLILEPTTFAGGGVLSNCFALITLASSTANWTMTGRFEGFPNQDFEYNGFGMVLYESSTGKFITHEYQRTYSTVNSLSIDKWNSASSFSGTPATQRGQQRWIRVVHASGTYSFQFSAGGKRFIQLYSESDTAFLAGRADKVGLHMGCARSTNITWQYTCQNFSIV